MRNATPTDIPLLLDFMQAFHGESNYTLDRQQAQRAFTALLANPALGQILLVTEAPGQAPIGYLVLTYSFAMDYAGLLATIDDFYIQPPHRSLGHGTRVLTYLSQHLRQQHIHAIHVQTSAIGEPANTFYRRAGYTATDHQHLSLHLT